MKILLMLSICLMTVAEDKIMEHLLSCEWTVYKAIYNRNYSEAEDYRRREVYKENRKRIVNNHELLKKNKASFSMNINSMTDMLRSEIHMKNGIVGFSRPTGNTVEPLPNVTVSRSVDWRSSGLVTPVWDQGYCGCCYAIATAQVLEGQMLKMWKEQNSKANQLGIQSMIDCSTVDGNYGCEGGLMTTSYEYIMRVGGLEAEVHYPYKGEEGKCMLNQKNHKISIKGYKVIKPGDEKALEYAVSRYGPVAIGIDASLFSFIYFKHGIYYDHECSSTTPNHATVVVGFGTDNSINQTIHNSTCNGKDYWLIKNSWGTDWGNNGYVRLAKGCNHCAVAQMASYPLVDKVKQQKTTLKSPNKLLSGLLSGLLQTTKEQLEQPEQTEQPVSEINLRAIIRKNKDLHNLF